MSIVASSSTNQTQVNEANNRSATATAYALTVASVTTSSPNPYPPYKGILALDDPLDGSSNRLAVTETVNGGSGYFTGGMFHLAVTQRGILLSQDNTDNFSDLVYQVRMVFIKGFGGGIVFRGTETSYYYFRITSDGSYTFNRYANTLDPKVPVEILNKGSSSVIKTGLNQSNLIAVVAIGNSISLYINLHRIASIKDDTYSQGLIGLVAAGMNAIGQKNPSEVAFSNAKVWTL